MNPPLSRSARDYFTTLTPTPTHHIPRGDFEHFSHTRTCKVFLLCASLHSIAETDNSRHLGFHQSQCHFLLQASGSRPVKKTKNQFILQTTFKSTGHLPSSLTRRRRSTIASNRYLFQSKSSLYYTIAIGEGPPSVRSRYWKGIY